LGFWRGFGSGFGVLGSVARCLCVWYLLRGLCLNRLIYTMLGIEKKFGIA
ncbi:MAG: hypothetical protein RIS47_2222, partial [Bacteroidota bacterium]